MTDPAQQVAVDLLETVPAIFRTIAGDLRHQHRHHEHHHRTGEPAHLRVLGALYREGDRTLGELADLQRVSAPTMSRTVATLEERGLVARTRDPSDRRVVRVSLTDEGRETLRNLQERGRAMLAERLQGISTEEADAVRRGLRILRDHLVAETQEASA